MTLYEILKAKGSTVYTVDPEASLQDVTQELVRHNVGSLVVCHRDLDCGEQLLGIITERDIIRFCASGSACLTDVRVAAVMTTKVVTGSPSDAVETVMGVMTTNRIRHLPVISNGRLVGVISIGDIVKSQHDQLAMENQFMKNYITG